jgi:hypothetical protein
MRVFQVRRLFWFGFLEKVLNCHVFMMNEGVKGVKGELVSRFQQQHGLFFVDRINFSEQLLNGLQLSRSHTVSFS